MYLEEDYIWLVSVLAALGVLVALTVWGGSYFSEQSCKAKAVMMSIPFRYTMLTGCMVEVTGAEGNRFMPLTSLRIYSHVQ